MKIKELVDQFLAEQRTVCQLLGPEQVLALGVAALQFFAGYGHADVVNVDTSPPAPAELPVAIDWFSILIEPQHKGSQARFVPNPTGVPVPPMEFADIGPETGVTLSDWSLIRPLFIFYCEREQALLLESSRVQGVDVFGRSSAEVQQDITAYESDLPQKAYCQPVITV